jgi:Protein of unknown function (DUF3300)
MQMNVKPSKRILSAALCLALVAFTMPIETGALMPDQEAAPASASSTGSAGYPGQGAAETAEELQGLVAPIALYPDALVAQILSAATFPDQVAVANYWVEQNKSLTGNDLMQAVNKQSWDPSVKALTEFPTVLNNMAQNLSWTSQLGEAYHNQQADVMAAVQTLRAQAKAAGNLKSGSQITVVQQTPQTIVIQPTNPQIVYVPQYNPTVVYGTAYVVPAYVAPTYSTADVVATGLLSFGAGMAVGAMMSGGCCGWGYSSWNCNWYHGGGAYYGNHPYYGNSAWHGGYYGNGYDNANHYNNGYNSSGYHANSNYNHGYNSSGYHANNYSHNTNVSGNTVNVNNANRQNASADHSNASASSRGWGQSGGGSGRGATAFSGFGDHGSGGGGGWGDRSASSRGWGSRGGGGGWGGGGFRGGGGGGGFRR